MPNLCPTCGAAMQEVECIAYDGDTIESLPAREYGDGLITAYGAQFAVTRTVLRCPKCEAKEKP